MRRRGDQALDRMRARVLDGPGDTDNTLRRTAFTGRADDVPESLRTLVQKVRECAYRVTDEDMEAALAAGWTQRQLFEVLVATAAGAGLHRRDVLDRLLAETI